MRRSRTSTLRALGHRALTAVAVTVALVAAGCGSGHAGDRSDRSPARSSASATSVANDAGGADGAPVRVPTTATRALTGPADPDPAAVAGERGTPIRIVIPAIGVDAAVVDLDRNPDGTLEVPGWDDAGWWRRGPEPGERGPAVIVGHVDSRSGPAVFYRLDELAPGDLVEIPLDGGGTSRYVVDRSVRFAKAAFPTRDVYGLTDGPELRLITCDGEFDESTGHYVDNLVVFATPA